MPHVVKWVGVYVTWTERVLVKRMGRSVLVGGVLWFSVMLLFLGGYGMIHWGLSAVHPILGLIFDGLVVFQSIAFTDLVKHVLAVAKGLGLNLETGRDRVSWIVGRDTDRMDEAAVCRAAIESGAENFNDGVIAPLFWMVLLGPVGALFFRLSNTMDAMVGHRNKRFEKVGKLSARVDDVLGFIPARLSCLLLLGRKRLGLFGDLGEDARKHPSWNAGWPEAAMAKRLGVVIGGEMYAQGKLVQTKEMNAGARQPGRKDIVRSTQVMRRAYLWALIAGVVFWMLGSVVA